MYLIQNEPNFNTPPTVNSTIPLNMAILPELTGGQFLQAFERRSVPVYQGCIALERDTNVISVGPVDTINPSDCANVCATHGSRDVGINAQ